MASRNRLRKVVSAQLKEQFEDWGLPRDIDYKTYCKIVDKPVTPLAIKKSFYNWKTAVHGLRLPEETASPEPVQVVQDPLAALSQGSVQVKEIKDGKDF